MKIPNGADYTVGRLLAVVTKPLCLFAANNFFAASTAQGLAIVFLASSLAMVGVAAGSHRRFYAQHFAEQTRSNGYAFHIYAVSVGFLAAIGCVTVLAIVLHFAGSAALAAAAVIYFLSEKLADELLRLRLFERSFSAWGRASIARNLSQMAGLVVLFLTLGQSIPPWLAVLLLALGNFWVFMPKLPRSLGVTLGLRRPAGSLWLLRRAVLSIRDNWILWAIALLGESVGYLDRLVALALDKAILPLFMLVVMCFSIVQMAIDFYYVSRHRRDFLEQRISAADALSSPAFIGSCALGLVLSGIACFLVLFLSHNGGEFPLGYVAVIAVFQLSMATTAIPREIIYWSSMLRQILRIEMLFWMLFCVAILFGLALKLPVTGMFSLAAGCVVARLGLYLMNARRLAPAHPAH